MSGGQLDLFARQGVLFPGNSGAVSPSLSTVRERLEGMMDTARRADRMPWTTQRLEVIRIVSHQMADWLPPAERDATRAAFLAELARLGAEV